MQKKKKMRLCENTYLNFILIKPAAKLHLKRAKIRFFFLSKLSSYDTESLVYTVCCVVLKVFTSRVFILGGEQMSTEPILNFRTTVERCTCFINNSSNLPPFDSKFCYFRPPRPCVLWNMTRLCVRDSDWSRTMVTR